MRIKALRLFLILFLIIASAVSLWCLNLGHERFFLASYPQKYERLVKKYSKQNGLSESLVYSIMRTESHFDPDAKSYADAKGLMQITPDTFEWLQTKLDEELPQSKLYDPETSVKYGSKFLSLLLDEFSSEEEAVCAYHAGMGNVKKWLKNKDYSKDGNTLDFIPIKETREYTAKVMDTIIIYEHLYYS